MKTTHLKRIVSAVSLLLAFVLVCGCSGPASGSSVPTTSNTESSSTAASTTTAAPTTTTTSYLPEAAGTGVSGIPEGVMADGEALAFASGTHSYVEWTQIEDEEAGMLPSVYNEDGSFFDDFANGIDSAHWHLVQQRWGAGNDGVHRSHVNYTDNGIVVLEARGDYYEGKALGSGVKRSGACIVTKDTFGPGSFEVRMKVLPRMGTCTAMWTYFNDGARNHEIDIEIPGNTRTFRYSLFTNWVTEALHSSKHKYPDFYHNDGEWHTYRFDWHTDPQKIEYYIDGVRQVTTTTHVPTVEAYFWVGVWFPKDWCGTPLFDTAYMLVDWVKYTPFDEPYETNNRGFTNTPASAYPTAPIELPVNNYAANGNFNYSSKSWTSYGDTARVLLEDGNRILRLGNENSAVTQNVFSINPDGEYTITATGAVSQEGSVAKVLVQCMKGSLGTQQIVDAVYELEFTSTDMTPASLTFTAPQGTTAVDIAFLGEGEGAFYFDDLYLTQPTRGDFVLAE